MSTPLTCTLIFFFNDTATTEIYTLSLHDALPICSRLMAAPTPDSFKPQPHQEPVDDHPSVRGFPVARGDLGDRKSTRLNSSHGYISYAVFCLKKKKLSLSNCYDCGRTGQAQDRSF